MRNPPRTGTPLRYPGGKQRLTPFVREVLLANDLYGCAYAEPYAGGAGVAVSLLLAGDVSQIHLNDADPRIAAFWTAATTHTDALCKFIESVELTVDEWRKHREVVKHPSDHDTLALGCSTFYLNRCNRSGVLGGGLIGGKGQTGTWLMDARFNRTNLVERIQCIGRLSDAITVTALDAEVFATTWAKGNCSEQTLMYFDPPYYERAQSLYLNAYEPSDHARVADTIQNSVTHPWIVSYDNHTAIHALYGERRSFVHELQYSAAKSYKGAEVFIFSDSVQVPSSSRMKSIEHALTRFPATRRAALRTGT